MALGGDTADVPAVAGGEQGEQADGGVFGGVGGAGGVDAVQGVEGFGGEGPPDGPGLEGSGREVQGLLADDLAGLGAAHLVGDDLLGDFDGAEVQGCLAPGLGFLSVEDSDVGEVAGRGGVVGFGGGDQGDGVLEVEEIDQVGLALVQVDGAFVDGGVGRGRVDGAEQPARTGFDDLDGKAAGAAQVGQVGGTFPARPEPACGT